jgi:hypothetical protein
MQKNTEDRIKEIQTVLEHSPFEPGPIADGLVGWEDSEVTLCAVCVGRLHARGCGNFVKGMSPVWDDVESLYCVGCSGWVPRIERK